MDLVLICTRHDSHGTLALEALRHGKHVFVEKPLATSVEQLEKIEAFYKEDPDKAKPLLMVGFNRRFSPHAKKIKSILKDRVGPAFIQYDMNAWFIPPDHWVHGFGRDPLLNADANFRDSGDPFDDRPRRQSPNPDWPNLQSFRDCVVRDR